MKNVYTFLLSFLICLPLFASAGHFVEKSEAETLARNFYYERLSQFEQIDYKRISVHDVSLVKHDDPGLYYVVNLLEGFVLVSAWKNVFPILAYSFEGHFDTPKNEANVAAWLSQYEKQIQFALRESTIATPEILQAWTKYLGIDFAENMSKAEFRNVEPMLTSKWDQGMYYNGQCPDDPAGIGGHCVTGCVATAMGQLLYYFRFPESGTGSYSYEDPNYGTISADFAAANYDYNQMLNQLTSPNAEVAELISHLGVSVDMVYGPDGSGMYNHKAAYSLRTHFKMSPETQYVYRDSTSMNWDSLIVAHLDNKIPLYYAGWSVPNIYGHAFICDGYQGDNFYHFNWGWSGSYDGYFYTGELTPGGNNFNIAQELIINAFPDTNAYAYPDHCTGYQAFQHKDGTITDGSFPVYNYNNLADCQWLIDPQNEQDSITNITLSFQRFNTENDADILSVYDGETTASPLLGSFSGSEIPESLTSSGNKMLLTFSSDEQNTAPGFFASYKSNQPGWCAGVTSFTEQQGHFSDGSYSFFYNNGSMCMWYIAPPDASTLTLDFESFDTEADLDCLEIYDGVSQELLEKYSGYYPPDALPPPVTSENGELYCVFYSNNSVRAQGWEANYYTNLVDIDEEPDARDILKLYPIPAHATLNVEITNPGNADYTLSLINSFGLTVKSQQGRRSHTFTMDVSKLKPGMYWLNYSDSSAQICKKVLIF